MRRESMVWGCGSRRDNGVGFRVCEGENGVGCAGLGKESGSGGKMAEEGGYMWAW